jgi:hypothetical protein
MIKIQLCVCAIVAVVAAGLPVSAQSWETLRGLKPGDRVKVQETGGQEHSGALRAVSADAISVAGGNGEVAIEKARVRTVKVRASGRRVRNLLIGAAIGVAVGITVDNTLGTYFRNESGQTDGARAVTYIAPIAILGGIGAALPAYRTVYKAR